MSSYDEESGGKQILLLTGQSREKLLSQTIGVRERALYSGIFIVAPKDSRGTRSPVPSGSSARTSARNGCVFLRSIRLVHTLVFSESLAQRPRYYTVVVRLVL